jgi:hypothetical protein
MIILKDLDEIMSKDQEAKINWLIGEVYHIKQNIKTIKSNHLHHINEELGYIKRKLYLVSGIIITILTGQNLLM